jgi:uncharacterized protein GlcG (DUF336 family)
MRAAVYRNPDLVTLARGNAAWRGGGVPLGPCATAIGAVGISAVDQDHQVAEALLLRASAGRWY